MQLPKPQSTVKRAVPPPPPLPPGYEHRRKTPAPVPAPAAPKPAKPPKQPKPAKPTKPAKQPAKSRKTKTDDLQNTAVATATRKRRDRPRMANPYAALHEVRAPYTQFPSTLTALAEIFFMLEYEQVVEFKPRTLGEHMIRSAWLKAIQGDTKAMTLLWDRIHVKDKQTTNPLADFLASLGQSAGLKPVTQYPEDQDDED